MISLWHATILGIVEGLTAFLPVSSWGHMIVTSYFLKLPDDAGVKAFEVVIQVGALLAVAGLYFQRVRSMAKGLLGKDPEGLNLALQILTACVPALIVGLAVDKYVKRYLTNVPMVVAAFAVGGVLMIVLELSRRRKAGGAQAAARMGLPMSAITLRAAFIIGLIQCLALWPGTSRSMVTILAALFLGYNMRAAAEFSFLLGLPMFALASVHDFHYYGGAILASSGWLGLALGFFFSFIVAVAAVKAFLAFLTRHGMAVFGYYRIVLAAIMAYYMWGVAISGKPDAAPPKPKMASRAIQRTPALRPAPALRQASDEKREK